jgi:hypothetical protein
MHGHWLFDLFSFGHFCGDSRAASVLDKAVKQMQTYMKESVK